MKGELTEDVIDELEQRLIMVDAENELRTKTRKTKLDSSQINDGDFEKIMNGLKEGAYVTFDNAQNTKRYSSSVTIGSSNKCSHPPPVEPKPKRISTRTHD
ncbi:unnamed protein product [Gongylonema pulchrum]|uniref:Esa1-associated factor 6 homolog n=1 Tax=Gongylonema pulchrum TaxID=637853 RepID=A0A183E122_9BILA|nr:unnamed protein product [Gongylonema pulchrum]